jgi:cell division protein FtsW
VSSSTAAHARSTARTGPLRIDWVTVMIVLAIVLLGLVMVTSASISIATKETGNPFLYVERQLVFVVIGLVGAATLLGVRTEWLQKHSMLLLVAAAAMLVLVLIPGLGHVVNGSRRWLRIAGLNFQASELARVLVLIFVAAYAARRERELRETLLGLVKPLGLLAVFFVLLLLEPDFGAATVLFVTGFGVLFMAGARLRYVLLLAVGGVGVIGLVAMSEGYRARRLTSFMNPWADPFDTGFQLTQSLIAIGRGEWLGVGLGESVQKLFYLPEAHTDFLFAVLAEELGLLGVLLTLGLFLALSWRALYIARLAADAGLKFQSYLAVGFGIWIGIQAFINIGVNMGVLPTKGLTLPLMSYGRSSLIVTLTWVGLLLRVHHEALQSGRGPAAVARRAGGARGAAGDESPARAAGATA